jgi:predicted oxidoreductase
MNILNKIQQEKNNHRIISGMMRLTGKGHDEAMNFLDYAYGKGVIWFDHADIYGNGDCERTFGTWLKSRNIQRNNLIIQSKCGIRPGVCYDNSQSYILKSVDDILSRLGCDYLDVFLIHRPDALWEPEEISSAFDKLYDSGKVRTFGVSNFNPVQIEYLQKHTSHKISFNQMQLSLAFAPMISEGLETNTYSQNGLSRAMGILDYCRLHNITIQTWSPLQFGTFNGSFIDNPNYGQLNTKLWEIAQRNNVSKTAIAAAWNLRIDKNVQVISGTTNPEHLDDFLQAPNITLTREEWYSLYTAAGYSLP